MQTTTYITKPKVTNRGDEREHYRELSQDLEMKATRLQQRRWHKLNRRMSGELSI